MFESRIMHTSSAGDLRQADADLSGRECVLVQTLDKDDGIESTQVAGIVSGIIGDFLYIRGPIQNPVFDQEFSEWTISRQITRVRLTEVYKAYSLPDGFDWFVEDLDNASDLDFHQDLFMPREEAWDEAPEM